MTSTETLARMLEKELNGALTLASDAGTTLAAAEKKGYLSPQELTELVIPVRFVQHHTFEKALNVLTERLTEAGIIIMAEKIQQTLSLPPTPTEKELFHIKSDLIPRMSPGKVNTYDEFLAHLAEAYRVTVDDLLGETRKKHIVFPRQVAMYILREDLGLPFPKIGTIMQRNHATIIHDCRYVAMLYESNAGVRADIEKIRAWCRGEPAPAETTTQPIDTSTVSMIRDSVLLIIAESFGLAKNELIVHATRPNEREKKRMRARDIAAYLLARDFNQPTQKIAECLGIKTCSTISRLLCEAERSIEGNGALQEIVARIRAAYTLAWYNGNVSEVLKQQCILFPKQREEAEHLCAQLRKKLESMLPLISEVAIPERSREVFLLRYGFADDSYRMMTLEEVGACYGGLTRERVRQILNHAWERLREGGAALPFGTTEALEKAIEEYTSWQMLIAKSK